MNWVFDLPNVLHGNILNDLNVSDYCFYNDSFQENCHHCPGSRLRRSQCVGIPWWSFCHPTKSRSGNKAPLLTPRPRRMQSFEDDEKRIDVAHDLKSPRGIWSWDKVPGYHKESERYHPTVFIWQHCPILSPLLCCYKSCGELHLVRLSSWTANFVVYIGLASQSASMTQTINNIMTTINLVVFTQMPARWTWHAFRFAAPYLFVQCMMDHAAATHLRKIATEINHFPVGSSWNWADSCCWFENCQGQVDPWPFVYILGMPSGFSSCILPLEDEWSQVFATSPILTPLALLIFRVFSAGIFLGHAIAHICYLALPVVRIVSFSLRNGQ